MNRIHILPDSLANQIAAGEVIERPASVVKELMENSIDADARDILIDLENGGTSLIRIADDGHGISREDLQLALHSHATSKIRTREDLDLITTLGFRGEALPSIAAVSQFRITSRDAESTQAWQIERDVLTGKDIQGPAAHNTGTTVVVKNLFHSTPARRKFLRSHRTEFIHALEMVKRITLSRDGIRVRMRHNGKQVFATQPGRYDHSIVVRTVMGNAFVEDAVTFDVESHGMRLWGWLARPEHARSQSDRQYFFLNGRIIRDRQVNHAVRMVYGDRVAAGRYPVFVVYMALDPVSVDVNVHPTKHEVRFSDARDVHDFIHASISQSLQVHQHVIETQDAVSRTPAYRSYQGINTHAHLPSTPVRWPRVGDNPVTNTDPALPILGQPLMLVDNRFMLTSRDKGCVVIDIDAARRYIVRQRLQTAGAETPVPSRPLLVPVSMPVTDEDLRACEKLSQVLGFYGLDLDISAPGSVMIRTIPSLLPDLDIRKVLQDLLSSTRKFRDISDMHSAIIQVFEDHAGSQAEITMTRDSMHSLLYALDDSGIDTHADDFAGIWKTLDARGLGRLIG